MRTPKVEGVSAAKKAPTVQDVAAYAHVSTATVSRVLNGIATVDPALAERVREAAAALQYRPNRAARSLAGGRRVLIGVVLGNILNPFFLQIAQGIEEVMLQQGYLTVVCQHTKDAESERQYLEILCEEGVAGVVICPWHEQSMVQLWQQGIPVVSVDQRIRLVSDAVLIDNIGAAREAVAHLIANGYRRIGLITGPLGLATARGRLDGYRLALHDAGIAHDPLIERHGSYEEEAGWRYTDELLDVDPPIEALLTANYSLAIGALNALYGRGLRVPDDLALVAFDEVPWVGPGAVPLTTVIQPAYEIGRTAATRLVYRIQHPDPHRQDCQEIVLPHQLRVGESSRPRRAAAEAEAQNRSALAHSSGNTMTT